MTFTATTDIAAGDQLTIDYGGSAKRILRWYGFACRCGACERPISEEMERRWHLGIWD